jgi:hypothetical protein
MSCLQTAQEVIQSETAQELGTAQTNWHWAIIGGKGRMALPASSIQCQYYEKYRTLVHLYRSTQVHK